MFPSTETTPTMACLTSLTGRVFENLIKNSANLMHWFITASLFKLVYQIFHYFLRLNQILFITSERRLISSIWLVNIESMPAWVLTVSISDMLIAFTNETRESLAFALSFLFNSYSCFVILLFLKEIFWISNSILK